MSDKAIGAENQQGRSRHGGKPSETICQTPLNKRKILAYLNGAIHDASLNKKKRIRFAQKDRNWLETLKDFLEQIGYNSWIYKEGRNRNVYILETLCKDLNFGFEPRNLKTRQEKISYIKGFFDAEGGLPHSQKDKFYIQITQKDFGKLRAIKKLLKELGIGSGKIHNPSKKVDPDYWRIFISTKHHRKFAEIINSYHPLKAKIFRQRMKI